MISKKLPRPSSQDPLDEDVREWLQGLTGAIADNEEFLNSEPQL